MDFRFIFLIMISSNSDYQCGAGIAAERKKLIRTHQKIRKRLIYYIVFCEQYAPVLSRV